MFARKKSYEGSAPPRFDIMERLIKDQERARSGKKKPKRNFESVNLEYKMPRFDPLIDPKSYK